MTSLTRIWFVLIAFFLLTPATRADGMGERPRPRPRIQTQEATVWRTPNNFGIPADLPRHRDPPQIGVNIGPGGHDPSNTQSRARPARRPQRMVDYYRVQPGGARAWR